METQNMPLPRIGDLFQAPIDLAQLLDGLPLAMAILDRDRNVLLINSAMEVLTGFPLPEVRGVRSAHMLRSTISFDLLQSSAPTPEIGPVSEEGDIITKSRQKIPVRATLSPVFDQEGNLQGYLQAVEDLRLLRMLDHGAGEGFTFGTIVGKSREMEKVYQVLPTLAQNDTSVLITGETGTGKDLVAEAIHQASARAKGPFVKVNCGALPENLLESELFGHRKGAFTGAVENKPGWFRLAHNGTLFLTEIGDLPLPLQVKLLTFLDDKVIYPLGSTKGIHVDVRVIAATHRDLQEMVAHGRFRQDLLFRLNVIRLHLPPLRERGEDIRLLVEHFLRVLSKRFKKNVRFISREALALLLEYPYPGNVRELRNIIEYGLTLCTSDRIEPEHLPAYMTEVDTPRQPVSEMSPSVPERRRTDRHATWDSLEREMIQSALVACSGNRGETARKLGWSRSTLWRKMKKHGIG